MPARTFASTNIAQAAGFVPLHAVRVLFPAPDHVYKGPQLHFEVKNLRISDEQVPCFPLTSREQVISDAPFGPAFDHEIVTRPHLAFFLSTVA